MTVANGAGYRNVSAVWSGGNLSFEDGSGNIIATFDGTNRQLTIPTGSKISQGGATTKRAVVTLTGGTDTAGGLGNWVNPEAGTIWIMRLTASTQGTGGHVATSAFNLDAGTTATNSTTLSDNLIDGLDLHTAASTGDNLSNPGANGKAGQSLASGKWVTFSTGDSTASAGLVAEAIIDYLVL